MKRFSVISLPFVFFVFVVLLSAPVLGASSVDTVTQNIKLETPDIYIYGKLSKLPNIKFGNTVLYNLLNNTDYNPRYYNDAFVKEKMLSYLPNLSFYGGIIFDYLPSENFGIKFQKNINGYTPYFSLGWQRIGYLFSGNYFKSPQSKIKIGVQSNTTYLDDICFRYLYYDYTFYNNIKDMLFSLSYSNQFGTLLFNKFNNDISAYINGKYNYKNGMFNYDILYGGFADTLNRFLKMGLDTHLPEFLHNTLTIGFSLYPFISHTPHIFTNLSMNNGIFGYSITYSMEKNITSAFSLFDENNFIASPRSFIWNKKHHIHSVFYINDNNFSLNVSGDYFLSDSMLIPIYTAYYTTSIVNNIHSYRITIGLNYKINMFNFKSLCSYNKFTSNQYSFEPDHYAINFNFSTDIFLPKSILFETVMSLSFLNKNIAGINYPDSYGLKLRLNKSIGRNIKLSFEANNLLNSFYRYNNILPTKERNFEMTVIFTI